MLQYNRTSHIKYLAGVRLTHRPRDSLWDIAFDESCLHWSITPHQSLDDPGQPNEVEAPLVLPSLVHPHIHLDKAFIHSSPEYADLLPTKGTFQEALSLTTKAKERFTLPDLLCRGNWLIAESVAAGVTAMRAFVEVDSTVQLKCLEAGIQLKNEWKDICRIQIAAFAQDPLFSGEHGQDNRQLMEDAIRNPDVDVVGTTPYVELDQAAAESNISWAIQQAVNLNKHLDLHLDYHLDSNKNPTVWYVLECLRNKGWNTSEPQKKVMLGHCTRLTYFSIDEWCRLSREIQDNNLPVSFVGLPTSDLYMAATPASQAEESSHVGQPRGTLPVIDMIRRYGLNAVIGVNNVGNGFTPWGNADPLSLACLGLGLYQKGSQADAELLYECVSCRARAAIGLAESSPGLDLANNLPQDLLVVSNEDDAGFGYSRHRKSIADVVYNPPTTSRRETISGCRLVNRNVVLNSNAFVKSSDESVSQTSLSPR